MSILPDELWRRILQIGVEGSNLSYKDLCCLSITCRSLHSLSDEDSLWFLLLSSDFKSQTASPSQPLLNSSPASSTYKALYKIRYERDRQQKLLAHRRTILRVESEIAECRRKIREIELQYDEERERMRTAAAELSNLQKIRQASVALNVWQPEVIRGRQKQIVEQCDVHVESRISALEMELRLCKQQIAGHDKALKVEKGKLESAIEKLALVKYHPLHDFNTSCSRTNEHGMRRKKLKPESEWPAP